MLGKTKSIISYFNLILWIALFLILADQNRASAILDLTEECAARSFSVIETWEDVNCQILRVCENFTDYSTLDADQPVNCECGYTFGFVLPQGSALKIMSPGICLTTDDFLIESSNGTGLYIPHPGVFSLDGSLLICPDYLKTTYLRITRRKSDNIAPLSLNFFKSTNLTPNINSNKLLPDRIVLYRDLFEFPAMPTYVRQSNEGAALPYWCLRAGEPISLLVQGPTRIMVESKLRYACTESNPIQHFWMNAQIDDCCSQFLLFDVSAVVIFPSSICECIMPFSHRDWNYIDIPQGVHNLTLSTSMDSYFRISKRECSPFLLPCLNNNIEKDLSQCDCEVLNAPQTQFPAEVEPLAYELAQNNIYFQSGLLSSRIMEAAVAQYPYDVSVLTSSRRLANKYTHFSNLFPLKKNTFNDQYYGYYDVPILEYETPPVCANYIGVQHVSSVLEKLHRGFFIQIPKGIESAHIYPIPPLAFDSQLRIAVDRNCLKIPCTFYLQYDQNPPEMIFLPFACAGTTCPNLIFKTSDPQSALNILYCRDSGSFSPTMSGQFGQYQPVAPQFNISNVDIPLPKNTKQVRVWSECEFPGLCLSLQYQTSLDNIMTESAYYTFIEQLGGSLCVQEYFKNTLNKAYLNGTPIFTPDYVSCCDLNYLAQRELFNTWFPMLRFFSHCHNHYKLGILPLPSSTPIAVDKVNAVYDEAIKAEGKQDWLLALRHWSFLQDHVDGELRKTAVLHKASILKNLGQLFVAESLLRSYYLQTKDPEFAKEVYLALLSFYREYDSIVFEENDAQGLIITQAFRAIDDDVISELIKSFANTKKYSYALLLSLLMTKEKIPQDEALIAANSKRWWRLYCELVENMPEQKRAVYLGYMAQNQGEYSQALLEWKVGGNLGQQLSNLLKVGQCLQKKLQKPSACASENLFQQIADWYQSQPGPRIWKEANYLITDYLAGIKVYSPNIDLYDDYYTANEARPVKLKVVGPTKLQFVIRPLIKQADLKNPLNTWVVLRDCNNLAPVPIINAFPNTDLIAPSRSEKIGGHSILNYEVPMGEHELFLTSEKGEMAIQVYVEKPAFPLTVLPSYDNPATYQNLKKEYKTTTAGTLNDPFYLSAQRYDELFSLPQQADPDDIVTRMNSLLWIAEHDAKKAEGARSAAIALTYPVPVNLEVDKIRVRLVNRSLWKLISNSISSSGSVAQQVKGWETFEEHYSAIEAIFNLSEEESLIYGYRTLNLAFNHSKPTVIKMTFKPRQSLAKITKTIEFTYQLDDQQPNKLTLSPDAQEEVVNLPVEAGKHHLSFSIINPVIDQFVIVRLDEAELNQKSAPVVNQEIKSYYVATNKTPIALDIESPATIRIDQSNGDVESSHYKYIPGTKMQHLQFRPENNEEKLYARFFQRVWDPSLQETPAFEPPQGPLEYLALPPDCYQNLLTITNPDPLPTACFAVNPGILDFQVGYNRRQSDSFGTHQYKQVDRFWEFLAGYQVSFIPDQYIGGDVLYRHRTDNGCTFGVRLFYDYWPRDSSFFYSLDGSIFRQTLRPNRTPANISSHSTTNGTLKLLIGRVCEVTPKITHYPFVRGFIRKVNLNQNNQIFYNLSPFDQDVFTNYMVDHNRSIILGDIVSYRPWQDTEVIATASVNSRENVNTLKPAQFDLGIAIYQLIGDFEGNVGYRYTNYPPLTLSLSTPRSLKQIPTATLQYLDLGLKYSPWRLQHDRLEIDCGVNLCLNHPVYSFSIAVSWYFDGNLNYKDYRPLTIFFKDLKQQRAFSKLKCNK